MSDKQPTAFEAASESGRGGLATEFFQFLKHNKKYWLIPLLLALLCLGILVMLGGSAVAPFIYTLF